MADVRKPAAKAGSGKNRRLKKEALLSAFFDVFEKELVSYAGNVSDPAIDYAIDRQFTRCRKKARYERPDLVEEAREKFLAVNTSLESVALDLPLDIVNNAREYIEHILSGFTKKLVPSSIQETLDYGVLWDRWRFGPGASYGTKAKHTAEKVGSAWTVTSDCEDLVKQLRVQDPHFSSQDHEHGLPLVVVRGSRFETAPKNQDAVRPIAIEPLGNMAVQLAAGGYIAGALAYAGLRIPLQQPRNKLLALIGSRTGNLATIDESDASNRIVNALVVALMPRKWTTLLMRCRSPEIEIKPGVWIRCNMISTMGNGFTFALMTLLHVALLYAYRACRGGPRLHIDWSTAGVYGDDIIVRSSEYEEFTDILVRAGLKINHDKSFWDGPFRESCGGDYWNGYDVTPVYVKRLRHDADIYVAMNQLLRWGAEHDLLLWSSLTFLKDALSGPLLLVPEWYADTAGVRTRIVGRKFRYLAPKKQFVELAADHCYAMKLFSGGYVLPMVRRRKGKDGKKIKYEALCFTPRLPDGPRYACKKSRLPKGFLDGRDVYSFTDQASWRIEQAVVTLA